MKEKTKEEERKRIIGLYKAAYETDMREKEGNFCRIKRRKGIKKKKEGIQAREYAIMHRREEEERGKEEKRRYEEVKNRCIKKSNGYKAKVYIHKGDTKKPYKEIKPKIEERGAGRFCIDFDSDIIEEIRRRHHKSYKEIIEGAPVLIRVYDYNKSYFSKIPLNRKIDYTSGLLPYSDITEKSIERVNMGFLKEEYNKSAWSIGIKQLSFSVPYYRKIRVLIEGEEKIVIKGKYAPIKSAVEKQKLYGRSRDVNMYKDVEIKNWRDYLKNQRFPLYWRYLEGGFQLIQALKKELNTWCQSHNIETKKSHPYIKNIVESTNLKGYYKGNIDTIKNVWAQVQIIKERLLIENSAHKM